jgi:hypothetical protein
MEKDLMIRKCNDGYYEVVIPCEGATMADLVVAEFRECRGADATFENRCIKFNLGLSVAGRAASYFRTAKRVLDDLNAYHQRGKSP